MYLEKIEIKNYKNYVTENINFSKKINYITGKNGTGKTNLLDAIYYLSFTKSAFNKIEDENIKYNQNFFLIKGTYKYQDKKMEVKCEYKQGNKKNLYFNESPYEKISSHFGKIPAVLIMPYDSDIIRNSSYYRRRFFDLLISQSERKYLQNIIKYNKVLKYRNLVLKSFKKKNEVDKNQIQTYDEILIQLNEYIYNMRKIYLKNFKKIFIKTYENITKDDNKPNIIYNTKLNDEFDKNTFKKTLDYDILTEKTNFGIHKDDFLFYLNNKSIKHFASQGQQKSFIISLKMSEYEIIYNQLNIKPIMMLDDIFEKLDSTRINILMKYIRNKIFGQIFITDTLENRLKNINRSNHEIKIFNVDNGKINSCEE